MNNQAIKYKPELIFNMDEVPFCVDGMTSIDVNGERLNMLEKGNRKIRMSIVLTITASGRMLPAFVILKSNRIVSSNWNIPKDITVVSSCVKISRYMDAITIIKYINDFIKPRLNGQKGLLILDESKVKKHQN